MKEIILIGAGGHAAVIIDILKAMQLSGEKFEIKGLLDDRQEMREWMGYPILGTTQSVLDFNNQETQFIISIGSNQVRKNIYERYPNLNYISAIHPTAIIGSQVTIQSGTVVMPSVVINANSRIGKHVIINTGVIVEHDNTIGNFVHLSPNTTLSGGVSVGERCHIGTNSTVINGMKIGSNTTIGAGTTVIKDIPAHVVAVGSPAHIIKYKDEQVTLS